MSTDSPTPLPPAGWYPSPDGTPGQAWWDGTQWVLSTPEATPAVVPPAPDGSIPGLAMALQVLLGLSGVVYLITAGVEIFGIGAATSSLAGNVSAQAQLTAYDQLTVIVSLLTLLTLLATAVVWVVWQFRVARQVPGRTRRSPGWHAGSWFIPVVNWWFPYQNVADLWTAVGRARPGFHVLWWVLWVVGNIVLQISARIYASSVTLESYLGGMSFGLIGDLLMIAAAALAILTVRGITQGLLRGPAAAPYI